MSRRRILFGLLAVYVVVMVAVIYFGLGGALSATNPTIREANPYLKEIVYDDVSLRAEAARIVEDCPTGDKECQLNRVYRNLVENYTYYSDPRSREFIQSPHDTLKIKGGDCEDLTILLNSLLENLGVKTYIVLTADHAYSLACDVDMDRLWAYIKESVVTQFSRDAEKVGRLDVLVEDGKLYIVSRQAKWVDLAPGDVLYLGSNTSNPDPAVEFLTIKYDVTSTQPLTLYILPNQSEFEALSEGEGFNHYGACKREGVLNVSDSCSDVGLEGGLVLENDNTVNASVGMIVAFQYYYSPYELLQDERISFYEIGGQNCVVLDATAGRYGYPGFDTNLVGEKTAIDPVTKHVVKLT